MELVKVMGGLLLVVCGTLGGLYASGSFQNRVNLLEQYLKFLRQAKSMIGYTAADIREVLSLPASLPLLRPVLEDCLHLLEGGCELGAAWRGGVDLHVQRQSDRELLYSFGDSFGTSDVSGELNKLSLHGELVEQQLSALREELKTKRRIYRIIGMFSGVLTAVILL